MQKEVTINIGKVSEVAISSRTKDGAWVSKISFEGEFAISDVARILNLSRQNCPIEVAFSSAQARLDLEVNEVEVDTGVVK